MRFQAQAWKIPSLSGFPVMPKTQLAVYQSRHKDRCYLESTSCHHLSMGDAALCTTDASSQFSSFPRSKTTHTAALASRATLAQESEIFSVLEAQTPLKPTSTPSSL